MRTIKGSGVRLLGRGIGTDHCHRDLEKAVEDLSELLEQPIDTETIGVLRQRVTDKTVSSSFGSVMPQFSAEPWRRQVYVQKRNEIVLEDSAAGYLEGRWKWNTPVEGFD